MPTYQTRSRTRSNKKRSEQDDLLRVTPLLQKQGSALVEYVKNIKLCSKNDLCDRACINKPLAAVRRKALALADIAIKNGQVIVIENDYRWSYAMISTRTQNGQTTRKLMWPSKEDMQKALQVEPKCSAFFIITFAYMKGCQKECQHDTCVIATSEKIYFIDMVAF